MSCGNWDLAAGRDSTIVNLYFKQNHFLSYYDHLRLIKNVEAFQRQRFYCKHSLASGRVTKLHQA